jgi:Superfamily II DNA helicase
VTTILRTYGGGVENIITINEFAIAKKLNLPVAQVLLNFEKLEKDEIIKYTPPNKSANLKFLVPRDDDRTINAISKALSRLQHNKDFKASAIINFIENQNTCRSKQLLNYFEEPKSENCHICDICLTKKGRIKNSDTDIQNAIISILQIRKTISSREIVLKLTQFTEQEILNNLSTLLEKDSIRLSDTREFYFPENNN